MRRRILIQFLLVVATVAAFRPIARAAQDDPDLAWKQEIQFLEAREKRDAQDYHAPIALGYAYMKRARITGDASLYALAEERFHASVAIEKNNLEAMLALAEVYSAQHRFKDAIALTDKVLIAKPGDPASLGIKGDAQLNFGETAEAEKTYAALKIAEPGFYYQSRAANLSYMKGDVQGAIDMLTEALNDAPASIPADIAWCNVQIGQLYFSIGKFERAEEYYKAAQDALPGYVPALDHQAELFAARGNFDRAEALYKNLIERLPRPDLQQALGDLYLFRGMKEDAAAWHAQALAGYTKSAAAGNLHYAHHLAGFYCDSQENPAEALKWARKDTELRHSCYAYDTLAWALYKNGDYPGAAAAMKQALAGGIQDAHLYFHAGLILARAGDFAQGKSCAQKALTINPLFEKFHVHR